MFEDKKVIILGTGKFQQDFQYIFQDISPAYYISLKDECDIHKNIYPITYLLEEKDKENLLIIICDFDKTEAERKLDEMGFQRTVNYIEADDIFYVLDEPERLNVNNRQIAFWGSGEELNYFQENVSLNNDLYIDSNRNKCGKFINGKKVVHPDDIQNWKEYFVVITTLKYYPEISMILHDKCLYENSDYVFYRKLLPKERKLAEMLKKTIYAKPIQAPICERPFNYLEISFGGGFFCCCPAWLKENFGDINTDTCDHVWHSKAAEIFRLSIVNKTFCFCDWESCSYIDSHPKEDESGERYVNLETSPEPETVLIGIDGRCNLKCRQCRMDYLNYDEVDENMIKCQLHKIVDSQWLSRIKHVVFASYGEVFYSPIYKSLLFEGDGSKQESVGIICNGLLFTEEYFQKIKAKYNKINVSISVDAACAETYHIVRGGSWEKLIDNIKNLVRHRKNNEIMHIRLTYCTQLCNIAEIYDFIEYARELGVDEVAFQKIHYAYDTMQKEFDEVYAITDADDLPKENVSLILAKADLNDPFVNWFQLSKYIKYAKAKLENK